MRDTWLKLVDSLLRPARPHLERCMQERERHLGERRRVAQERLRAIADCEARIERARAAVFAAEDGVVTALMTDLEREWRTLSRLDPDAGLMDLWARLVPASWIDRKRWRDSDPAARLDAVISLASDVDGILAAETAIGELRAALATFGTPLGARLRWRTFDRDFSGIAELLAEPCRVASDAARARGGAAVALEHARALEQAVHEAALARLSGEAPERTQLARDLAHAAFVDCLFRAASLGDRPNPVTSLRQLWQTGYVISAVDPSGVTLELPSLAASVPSQTLERAE